MSDAAAVTEADVARLAELADLPLADGRAAVVAPSLAVWVTLANELNRKMSAEPHWSLTPIIPFSHPRRTGGQ